MGQHQNSSPLILVAQAGPDDCMLLKRALEDTGLAGNLQFVNSRVELMEYMRRCKCRKTAKACPRPDLILLDLKTPSKDGHGALRDMKMGHALQGVVLVALTGSDLQNDAKTKPEKYAMWAGIMGNVLRLLATSPSRVT